MLKKYVARQAERAAKDRAAAARWLELRTHFATRLTKAAGSVSDLVQRVEFTGPEEGGWRVWWERSELEQQVSKVRESLQRRYLTDVALQGNRFAGAAEWQSILLFEEAQLRSEDALIAALFITAKRSADERYDFRPSPDAREALSSAVDQAHDQLASLGIDTYSTARTRYLPRRFELAGAPQTGEDLVGQLGDLMGEFLAHWVPVRVSASPLGPEPE